MRLKKRNRATALGLVCVLTLMTLAVTLVITPSQAEPDVNTVGVTLLEKDPSLAPYLTNTWAEFFLIVNNSNYTQGEVMVNPTLTLFYEATDNDDNPILDDEGNPVVPKISFSKKPTTEGAGFAVWELDEIHVGSNFSWPISIMMPSPYTPDGFVLKVSANLDLPEDFPEPLVRDDIIEFKWESDKLRFDKLVKPADYRKSLGLYDPATYDPSDDRGEYDAYEVIGGVGGLVGGVLRIVDEYSVKFTLSFQYPQSNSYRAYESIVIKDYLPPGAVYDPKNDTLGWEYKYDDEYGDYVAVYEVDLDTYKIGDDINIYLTFPDAQATNSEVDPSRTDLYRKNRAEATVTIKDRQYEDIVSYDLEDSCYVILRANMLADIGPLFRKTAVVPKGGDYDWDEELGKQDPMFLDPTNCKIATRPAVPSLLMGEYWWIDEIYNYNQNYNPLRSPLKQISIQDDKLDSSMKFTHFFVSAPDYFLSSGKLYVEIHVVGESSWRSEKLIPATDFIRKAWEEGLPAFDYFYSKLETDHSATIKYDIYTLFDDLLSTDIVDGVRLSCSVEDELLFRSQLALALCSTWRNPEDAKTMYDPDNSLPLWFENEAKFFTDLATDTSKAFHRVERDNPRMVANHVEQATKVLDVPDDDIIPIWTRMYPEGLNSYDYVTVVETQGGTKTDAQFVVVLPRGVVYDSFGDDPEGLLLRETPDSIDFMGTGQMALVWYAKPGVYVGDVFNFSFNVKVTGNCSAGKNEFKMYYTWRENYRILAAKEAKSGKLVFEKLVEDIGSDVYDVGYSILFSNPYFERKAPTEVSARQWVRGSMDTTFKLPTADPVFEMKDGKAKYREAPGRGEAGSIENYYKVDFRNLSDSDLTELVILDVLPFVGDTGIEKIEEDGSRGSTIPVTLVDLGAGKSPITFLEGTESDFIVKFSPNDYTGGLLGPDNYTQNATWLLASEVTDWSTIKAIKVELISGKTIQPEEAVVFTIQVAIPADAEVGKIAYNMYSHAHSGNQNYFNDAERIGILVEGYDIKLTKDVDKDYETESYDVGEQVVYTITVQNNTNDTVTNVVVTDEIPDEVEYDHCDWPGGATPPQKNPETGKWEITVNLETLAGKASKSFNVYCTAKTPDPEIINIAEVRFYWDGSPAPFDALKHRDYARIRVLSPLWGSIHLRQLIKNAEDVDEKDLPQAYVDIITTVGNPIFNEWVRFDSQHFTDDVFWLSREKDDFKSHVYNVPLGRTYWLVIHVPDGYVLDSPVGWEFALTEEIPPEGEAVTASFNPQSEFTLSFPNYRHAWITIILRKTKGGPNELIRNTFPPQYPH